MNCKIFSLLLFVLPSAACTSAHYGEPSAEQEQSNPDFLHLESELLEEYREEIAEQIYNYIKINHPVTDSSFPDIQIEKVSSSNSVIYEIYEGMSIDEKIEALKSDRASLPHTLRPNQSLRNILQSVSDRFAAESDSTKSWQAYLLVNEVKSPSENEGLQISHGVTCIAGNVALGNWLAFGGLFICPDSSDRYVTVNALVVQDDSSTPIEINGFGASNYSTAFSGSDAEYRASRDALTKATIAAIAHATSELVGFYNTYSVGE